MNREEKPDFFVYFVAIAVSLFMILVAYGLR